jgi:RNA polymerase sigma factor (sigma-70 family)
MKTYSIPTYVKYKEGVLHSNNKIKDKDLLELTRDEMIIKFMPLVESLARKFSTSQQACGVMSIMDLIQEGNYGLCKAVDRLDKEVLEQSEDIEKTLKSFLSKRIRGAIRRGIDINRGDMRIPEHKLNEIRKAFGKDKKAVSMFFNSIFLSIDAKPSDDPNSVFQIPDESEPYNMEMLNAYLTSLLKQHLDNKEYDVLRLSYGLDCEKHSAEEIAAVIGITGSSAYVRVSQLKKQAVQKLVDNVDYSQVIDFL